MGARSSKSPPAPFHNQRRIKVSVRNKKAGIHSTRSILLVVVRSGAELPEEAVVQRPTESTREADSAHAT